MDMQFLDGLKSVSRLKVGKGVRRTNRHPLRQPKSGLSNLGVFHNSKSTKYDSNISAWQNGAVMTNWLDLNQRKAASTISGRFSNPQIRALEVVESMKMIFEMDEPFI
jgi:hypothetical protein